MKPVKAPSRRRRNVKRITTGAAVVSVVSALAPHFLELIRIFKKP